MSRVATANFAGSTSISDEDLIDRVLRREERAWHQLIRQFDPTLRSLIGESGDLQSSQVDDVLGDLWLRLMEQDMRRLRAFAASKSAPLSAWLAMQATQVAFALAQ